MLLSFAEKKLAEILQKKERKLKKIREKQIWPERSNRDASQTCSLFYACVWSGLPATGRPLSVSKKTEGSRLLMWTEACGAADTNAGLSFHS